MLYSEIKERENRFILALKIVFPFLLLIGIFFHSYKLFYDTPVNFILLILLIPIYVYYTVYQIYHGFQTTLIDPVTKTFIRSKIISEIEVLKNRQSTTIILLHISNLNDITERYGIANTELVLRHFIYKLEYFLQKQHFKHVPIGRYSNSNFLLFLEFPQQELKHIFSIFTKNIQNEGIFNIEVKTSFALVNANYDKKSENIIEKLLLLIEEGKKSSALTPHIKPDQFKMIIDEAISHNQLLFKYQASLELHTQKITTLEILTRIDSPEYGTLSKSQIQRMINHTGYETVFDEKIFLLLLDEIQPLLEKGYSFSVEISPVSLRNNHFKRYLVALFQKHNVDPKRFILEITEKKSYDEMHRFREIIENYQKIGFKIALGNFGGNNCGFEYLKHLPIDMVKFDIEFTKKVDHPKYKELLVHYLDLVDRLGIQSMIKFVDKETMFETIKTYEPDFIQGFYISKPKTLEQLQGEN